MIHFDLPKQKSSIIKVVGVGGGGSNAVNFMFDDSIEGVDFIICNTDGKALEQSPVPNKIQLGPHLTQGLGAGANPEVGKMATEESMEEIRRMLEVNTKMVFITAGMGGGTGTGGAPIVAQLCREMGILTVGIVTTPFAFEGPRRMQQAEEGIKRLTPYVDTLLVISNDKLRMQYGNLKMKEAFGKADNVLATAAKCITDIINSRGYVIVDFADVCTVMKNGGVAILGSSTAEGESRAQTAIEEALNSPLLNDNDIRGAKWILININSCEGEYECTMDEMDLINTYVRMQAGEGTDVIVGMGYDASLERKIGITLIATGFEQKSPFEKPAPAVVEEKPKDEKIVLTLNMDKPAAEPVKLAPAEEKKAEPAEIKPAEEIMLTALSLAENVMPPVIAEERKVEDEAASFVLHIPEEKPAEPVQEITGQDEEAPVQMMLFEKTEETVKPPAGSFLARPANIYAEQTMRQTVKPAEEKQEAKPVIHEDEMPVQFELVIKEDTLKEEEPVMMQSSTADIKDMNEDEEQRRRAEERLHKLRNLSYNMSSNENNAELDSVPAYVRRNIELFGGNTLTTVEDFYSKYAVKKDENTGQTQISTINKFLDGDKPD